MVPRFVQAVEACAGMIIGGAIISDLTEEKWARRHVPDHAGDRARAGIGAHDPHPYCGPCELAPELCKSFSLRGVLAGYAWMLRKRALLIQMSGAGSVLV